jgi:hypothetical protein
MQMSVLDPMDLKSSFFTQPSEKSKKKLLATGYKADDKDVEGKYHIYPEQAAAGLWTNPVDLCKYIIETVSSWNGQSDKVLTTEFTKGEAYAIPSGCSCRRVYQEGRIGHSVKQRELMKENREVTEQVMPCLSFI